MELVNPKNLKPKQARELVLKLQQRCFQLENCLDDLSRSVEIAQFTRQYDVTNVFVTDAEKLLEDRIVIPEINQKDQKFTLIEGDLSQDTIDKIKNAKA
jgi:hypothetical protein